MRRLLGLALTIVALGAAAFGCGGKFKLPTETRTNRFIPPDGSYQVQAIWSGLSGVTAGMSSIQDILLTQGVGSQLYLLFNYDRGGTDTITPRGAVYSVARYKPSGSPPPIDIFFPGLFNPVALASGGDGSGSPNNRIYVLDRGDTTIAHTNPLTGTYGDTTGGFRAPVKRINYHFKVREYDLLGGATISTFTDTTLAFPQGVAADEQGRVYVAGLAIVLVDADNPSIQNRSFLWRIFRYVRGPGAPRLDPTAFPDPYLSGATWHRDPTWKVEQGTGTGTVIDPRGTFWSPDRGGAVYAADYGNSAAKRLSDALSSTGSRIPASGSDIFLGGPFDVTADLQGYSYIADTGNQRVLRFDPFGAYVQRIKDPAQDVLGDSLRSPVAVAADDSLVFIGDAGDGTPGTARVIRYKRRQ